MLNEHGHVAEHVYDIGPADMPDRELWQYALDHQAAIITNDEDCAQTVSIGGESPAVVWVRVGNTRLAALLAWFEPLIGQIVSMVERGDQVIELR